MSAFITFIAHGSRLAEANEFLAKLIQETFSVSDNKINLGFLELASPSIAQALEAQIQNQATAIRVIPLFLAPGKHIQEDIPREIEMIQKKHPKINVTIEPFLGSQKSFQDLLKSLI